MNRILSTILTGVLGIVPSTGLVQQQTLEDRIKVTNPIIETEIRKWDPLVWEHIEAPQNDNYVLEANFTELIKRHPDIGELAVKYDFRSTETKNTAKAQEKGTSAWTALHPNTELNSILYADNTIYTGVPFEFYRDGAKIAVPQRTGPMIKTDLILQVLEADDVQQQLLRGINFDAIDGKLAHRNATARQLEFDVGLNIEEFLNVYAAHIETGGLRYPEHLPVNKNGVVEIGKIRWKTLKDPVSVGQLEGTSLNIPYVQNGVPKTGTLSWKK